MAKELNAILAQDDNVEMSDDGTNIKFRVKGSGWTSIVVLTQAEYDNLTPNATTLYFIEDE